MPYKRFDELNEEKKRLILETAMAAFASNSFKAASINSISKEAGLSAGALYYYFEDKKDLYYATLEHVSKVLSHYFGNMVTLFDQKGYWEGISEVVLKRLELSRSQPQSMRLFQRVLLSDDPVEFEGRQRLMAGFKEIFDYGYERGFIRKDLPRDFLFMMHFNMTITVNQFTLKTFTDSDTFGPQNENLRQLSMKAVDMIRAAMTE